MSKTKSYLGEIYSFLVSMAMTFGIALVIVNDMHPSNTRLIPIIGILLLIIFPIIFSIKELKSISKKHNLEPSKYVSLELAFLGENIPNILQVLSFSAIIGLYFKAYSLIILITSILLVLYLHYKRKSYEPINKLCTNSTYRSVIEINARISGWFLMLVSTIIALAII